LTRRQVKEPLTSSVKRPAFLLFVLCLVVYNLNKYHLRFLSMDQKWYRVMTDVIPNFMIVIIFFLLVSWVQPFFLPKRNARIIGYGMVVAFSAVLCLEEQSGIFNMSKVSDVNDSVASCLAAASVIFIKEVRVFLASSKTRMT
jgi:hypothetical protein